MGSGNVRSKPTTQLWSYRLIDGRLLEILSSELPAGRVCGDISAVYPSGEDSLLLAMGDASGHGVAAGMLIVDIRRLLALMAGSDSTAGEIMGRVNHHVMKRFPTSRFVTLTLLKVNMRTGETSFATAGQPFYRMDAEGRTTNCDSDNAPIGIIEDEEFQTVPIEPLAAGESLVLISDGFREALNNDGQMYGEPRLLEQLAAGRDLPGTELIDNLHQDVDQHKNGNTDHDDMTVVIVRIRSVR